LAPGNPVQRASLFQSDAQPKARGFALGRGSCNGLFGEGVVLNYEGQGAQARI